MPPARASRKIRGSISRNMRSLANKGPADPSRRIWGFLQTLTRCRSPRITHAAGGTARPLLAYKSCGRLRTCLSVMRNRFGVFETVLGFAACTSSGCGCFSEVTALFRIFTKAFRASRDGIFPPRVALAAGLNTPAAGSGCHLAWICWAPFVCDGVWPAAAGCVSGTHRGWVEVGVVVGAAPRWCGRLSLDVGGRWGMPAARGAGP
jgi:hypothetical protein